MEQVYDIAQTIGRIKELGDGVGEETFWNVVASTFEMMDWAEDEIARAMARHPDKADEIWRHTFGAANPGMAEMLTVSNERLYRAHVRELAERVAKGQELQLPTLAEVACMFHDAAMDRPLSRHAVGMYLRLMVDMFPEDEDYLLAKADNINLDTDPKQWDAWEGQSQEEWDWINKKFRQEWRTYKE